jgi:hypothetical protein
LSGFIRDVEIVTLETFARNAELCAENLFAPEAIVS